MFCWKFSLELLTEDEKSRGLESAGTKLRHSSVDTYGKLSGSHPA
jgi:hypothetical protein